MIGSGFQYAFDIPLIFINVTRTTMLKWWALGVALVIAPTTPPLPKFIFFI